MALKWYGKYTPTENVKLYAGLRGGSSWVYIVGVKIAGVKVIVPWTNIHNYFFPQLESENEYETEEVVEVDKVQEAMIGLAKQFIVTLCFTAGSYLYQCWLVKKREREIKSWIEEDAPKLYSRHIAEVKMIKERALTH